MSEELRISKRMNNGTFYLVSFLIILVLFYLIPTIFQIAFMGYYEIKTPGFIHQFSELVANGDFASFTNKMWGIMNYSQFFSGLIMLIILLIFLRKVIIRDVKRFKEDLWHNIGVIVFGFVLILVMQRLLHEIYTYFGVGGTSENQEGILLALKSSTSVFMYLSVVLLAPVVEELIFRKLLYGIIEVKFKLPKIASILISAVIFAALHDVKIFFFQYFFMALVLCSSYSLFKNNIIIPIGIHFLNNAMILAYIFMKIL